jgi:predicted GNAT family N-acyltransferase
LSLGLEFVNARPNELSAIAQYLVQFGSTSSLEELRDEGLYPKSVSQAVEYSFVRSEEELREVIALRTQTYAEAGKAGTNEYSADSYDAKSRIIMGKYKGKLVASARIYFPEHGDLLEHEEYVQLPDECSRRDDLVEVMRICTDPDFRRSDLLFSLFHFIGITCTQAKRHTIVGCATPDLVGIYTRIGFKDTGITYKHPLLNNKDHRLIITDTRRCILGVDVNPMVWNVLWRDTAKYLVDNDFLTQNTLSHMRILLYKALAPLAFLAKRKSANPRRRKAK